MEGKIRVNFASDASIDELFDRALNERELWVLLQRLGAVCYGRSATASEVMDGPWHRAGQALYNLSVDGVITQVPND